MVSWSVSRRKLLGDGLSKNSKVSSQALHMLRKGKESGDVWNAQTPGMPWEVGLLLLSLFFLA